MHEFMSPLILEWIDRVILVLGKLAILGTDSLKRAAKTATVYKELF